MGNTVAVLFFGPLRDVTGVREMHIEPCANVRAAWEAVVASHPDAATMGEWVRPAVNLTYCEWEAALAPGDTVAFIPPVAGGSSSDELVHVAITWEPIDVAQMLASVASDEDGAVATFVGRVRNHNEGSAVDRLDYETYEPMALLELRNIAEELRGRGDIGAVTIIHRVGSLRVGDTSVVIAVAAPHRAAALRGCGDAIEELKRRVPIWKREHRGAQTCWVDARCVSEASVP